MQHHFIDRDHAGAVLADNLETYKREKPIILALPRGGVPVGYRIARHLKTTLQAFVVRKLGVPGHSELALGAIAVGGIKVFNHEIIHHYQITEQEIAAVTQKETVELNRRLAAYNINGNFPSMYNRTVILVDDGAATGATMRAAIMAAQTQVPKKLVVALPVADEDVAQELSIMADEIYVAIVTDDLGSIGEWYDDFSQVEDEEVRLLLKKAR